MFIADSYNHRIRKVVCATAPTPPYSCTPPAGETAGYIYTVAGSSAGYAGDGGPATSAELYYPTLLRRILLATSTSLTPRTSNPRSKRRNQSDKHDCRQWCLRILGDGPALENDVYYPEALRADANGNVFFADTDNERIRWVDGGGTMTTFAGNGAAASQGMVVPPLTQHSAIRTPFSKMLRETSSSPIRPTLASARSLLLRRWAAPPAASLSVSSLRESRATRLQSPSAASAQPSSTASRRPEISAKWMTASAVCRTARTAPCRCSLRRQLPAHVTALSPSTPTATSAPQPRLAFRERAPA